MKCSIFFVTLFGISSALLPIVQINCTFSASGSDYICFLPRIEVGDDENQTILFGGEHVEGRRNEQVNHVLFEPLSNVPFIFTDMFTTFPNVIDVRMMDVGLNRIQTGAFANARNLEMLYIRNNSRLTRFEANSFTGASKLNYMELSNNSIESIHGLAFSGLESVRHLYLNKNRIRTLSSNVFKSMRSLVYLYLERNLIETLDARVLSNNPKLTTVFFDDNKIDAIGRGFLDGLMSLDVFAIRDNECVNDFFSVAESSTVEIMHQRLSECYENYDKQGNVDVYTLEIHGTLLISDGSGNVITYLSNQP